MGDGCPGCVDISPRQTSPGQSSPGLPTFASLRLKVDDDSVIWFSSGTTGPAKAIKRSDRFLQNQVLVTTYATQSIIIVIIIIILFKSDYYSLLSQCYYCRAMLSISAAYAVMRVCLSVCLCVSVTFVDHVKTNKHIFEFFSPLGSHTILVFQYQSGWRYSDEKPPNMGVECRWGRQKSRF